MAMKLPDTDHTARPWRIHDVAPDFRLEDVWVLPTPGTAEDFPKLVRLFAEGDTGDNPSWLARQLFTIRWRIGAKFGWDDPATGVAARVPSLRERLPPDLRDAPAGPAFDILPFRSVYLTDNEWAAEMANRTVHAVMHIGWVPDDDAHRTPAGYRGQLAVLVKPNGWLGRAYMMASPTGRLPAAAARHRKGLGGDHLPHPTSRHLGRGREPPTTNPRVRVRAGRSPQDGRRAFTDRTLPARRSCAGSARRSRRWW
jgi:hypothetical protein